MINRGNNEKNANRVISEILSPGLWHQAMAGVVTVYEEKWT